MLERIGCFISFYLLATCPKVSRNKTLDLTYLALSDIIYLYQQAAENLADELARSDGREVRLEEDPELALPFLLPEDGYSCEVVRGIPAGLVEFVGPLQHAGLCRLSAQPTSSGLWTVYMGPANPMVSCIAMK